MNDSNAARLFAILEPERWPLQLLPLLKRTRLPEWWVVAGCIAGAVWNRLTGRPPLTGIKDIDVVYFGPADLSEQGEVELAGRLRAAGLISAFLKTVAPAGMRKRSLRPV